MIRSTFPLFLLLPLSFVACDGRATETGSDAADADTDTDADSDTDADADMGFSVSGMAVDLASRTGAPEGLSVSIADPTAALGGGDLTILGTSTTAADSTFTVAGVKTTATLGLFMIVSGGTNMNTGTGIAYADYGTLGSGDVLADKTAYVVSAAMAGGIDASATPLGYTGTVEADGVLFILVRDEAGAPVDGATVSCGDCGAPIFYMDADPTDGLFTTGMAPNAGTSAAAGGLAVVPTGPIATYEAAGGGMAGTQLSGTLPGLAAFIGITVK